GLLEGGERGVVAHLPIRELAPDLVKPRRRLVDPPCPGGDLPFEPEQADPVELVPGIDESADLGKKRLRLGLALQVEQAPGEVEERAPAAPRGANRAGRREIPERLAERRDRVLGTAHLLERVPVVDSNEAGLLGPGLNQRPPVESERFREAALVAPERSFAVEKACAGERRGL